MGGAGGGREDQERARRRGPHGRSPRPMATPDVAPRSPDTKKSADRCSPSCVRCDESSKSLHLEGLVLLALEESVAKNREVLAQRSDDQRLRSHVSTGDPGLARGSTFIEERSRRTKNVDIRHVQHYVVRPRPRTHGTRASDPGGVALAVSGAGRGLQLGLVEDPGRWEEDLRRHREGLAPRRQRYRGQPVADAHRSLKRVARERPTLRRGWPEKRRGRGDRSSIGAWAHPVTGANEARRSVFLACASLLRSLWRRRMLARAPNSGDGETNEGVGGSPLSSSPSLEADGARGKPRESCRFRQHLHGVGSGPLFRSRGTPRDEGRRAHGPSGRHE